MWKLKSPKVHCKDIFAKKTISKLTKIIEYIDEKILKSVSDRRSHQRIIRCLKSETNGSVYIFELDKKYDIGGSLKYNKVRYINYS